jgi:chitinase
MYNNVCGLQNYNAGSWDFGAWAYWGQNVAPNKNVKIFLGAPASPSASGSGYVNAATLSQYAISMRRKYPNFGGMWSSISLPAQHLNQCITGVMLWDASQAWANGHFDKTVKNALTAAGGTGFTYPACSAPAWQSGSSYSGKRI